MSATELDAHTEIGIERATRERSQQITSTPMLHGCGEVKCMYLILIWISIRTLKYGWHFIEHFICWFRDIFVCYSCRCNMKLVCVDIFFSLYSWFVRRTRHLLSASKMCMQFVMSRLENDSLFVARVANIHISIPLCYSRAFNYIL